MGFAVVGIAGSGIGTAGLLLSGPSAPAETTLPCALLSLAGLVVLGACLRGGDPGALRRSVLGAGGALLGLAVALPPVASGDVWCYAMYGRIAAFHHANPYLVPPSFFRRDPFLGRVPKAWRSTKSVYGPGFTALSTAIARVTGDSALAARLAFQSLAVGAVVVVAAVLVRRRVPTIVLAAFVMNPVVVYWVVNGAHNDAIVGAAVLFAALGASRGRPWIVGVALAAAISVKASALLPAFALAWWLWRRRGARDAAIAVALAIGPVAAGYLWFGGMGALAPLRHAASNVSRATLWGLVPHRGSVLTGVPPILVVAVIVLLTVALGWRREATSASRATLHATTAYLIGGAYILPWYAVWALPLAALEHRSRIAWLVFGQSVVLALAYTYRPTPRPGLLDHVLRAALVVNRMVVLGVALALVFVAARRARLGPEPAVGASANLDPAGAARGER
jgi:hypothetical protein